MRVDVDLVRVDLVGVDLVRVDLVCTHPFITPLRLDLLSLVRHAGIIV